MTRAMAVTAEGMQAVVMEAASRIGCRSKLNLPDVEADMLLMIYWLVLTDR